MTTECVPLWTDDLGQRNPLKLSLSVSRPPFGSLATCCPIRPIWSR